MSNLFRSRPRKCASLRSWNHCRSHTRHEALALEHDRQLLAVASTAFAQSCQQNNSRKFWRLGYLLRYRLRVSRSPQNTLDAWSLNGGTRPIQRLIQWLLQTLRIARSLGSARMENSNANEQIIRWIGKFVNYKIREILYLYLKLKLILPYRNHSWRIPSWVFETGWAQWSPTSSSVI